jgi:hypothetical protein
MGEDGFECVAAAPSIPITNFGSKSSRILPLDVGLGQKTDYSYLEVRGDDVSY